MTKSAKFRVGVSMHGDGTSQCALLHLQPVSALANRMVQHTKLASVCLLVLCLLSGTLQGLCSPASSLNLKDLGDVLFASIVTSCTQL